MLMAHRCTNITRIGQCVSVSFHTCLNHECHCPLYTFLRAVAIGFHRTSQYIGLCLQIQWDLTCNPFLSSTASVCRLDPVYFACSFFIHGACIEYTFFLSYYTSSSNVLHGMVSTKNALSLRYRGRKYWMFRCTSGCNTHDVSLVQELLHLILFPSGLPWLAIGVFYMSLPLN